MTAPLAIVLAHRRYTKGFSVTRIVLIMTKYKIAVLISGRGSNLGAILRESHEEYFPGIIDCIISNNEKAEGLSIAPGIQSFIVQRKDCGSFDACDAKINDILSNRGIDLVCLAGFMRILGAALVNKWSGKILNIHPALLPSFKGLSSIEQALECGVKIAGCTVHIVEPEIDSGKIIAQAAIPVIPVDNSVTLANRLLRAEHLCYPYAIMKSLGVRQVILEEKISLAHTNGILLN